MFIRAHVMWPLAGSPMLDQFVCEKGIAWDADRVVFLDGMALFLSAACEKEKWLRRSWSEGREEARNCKGSVRGMPNAKWGRNAQIQNVGPKTYSVIHLFVVDVLCILF